MRFYILYYQYVLSYNGLKTYKIFINRKKIKNKTGSNVHLHISKINIVLAVVVNFIASLKVLVFFFIDLT